MTRSQRTYSRLAQILGPHPTRADMPASVHLYHCRFSPPLQTRRYPHMGEHVFVGWLLLAERRLPEMAPFNLRRREADLRGVHSVTVHPLTAAEGEPIPQDAWDIACRLDEAMRGWICTKPRQGFSEIAAALLTEYGVRFVPALARLPRHAEEPEDAFFTPPEECAEAVLRPADWAVLGALLQQQPAHEVLMEGLAEAGVSAEEMRELAREAQLASRHPDGPVAEQASSSAAMEVEAPAAAAAPTTEAAAAAAATVARAEELARRVVRRVQGRVVLTRHTGADNVCNDLDFVRQLVASGLYPVRRHRSVRPPGGSKGSGRFYAPLCAASAARRLVVASAARLSVQVRWHF